jgi:hypothetical protein
MGFSAIILMGYEVWVGQLQEARRNMFIRVIVARDPRPCMGNGCVEDFSISYTTGFLRVMTIGALTGCNLARRVVGWDDDAITGWLCTYTRCNDDY